MPRMADESKRPRNVESTPDAFGNDGRVQTVLNMLRNIQSQRFTLDVEVTANGLSDDSPAPGGVAGRTVKEHREHLAAAEARLADEYGDLMPDVQRLVSAQQG